MLKKRISAILVTMLMIFTIPGFAFASEVSDIDSGKQIPSNTGSSESEKSNQLEQKNTGGTGNIVNPESIENTEVSTDNIKKEPTNQESLKGEPNAEGEKPEPVASNGQEDGSSDNAKPEVGNPESGNPDTGKTASESTGNQQTVNQDSGNLEERTPVDNSKEVPAKQNEEVQAEVQEPAVQVPVIEEVVEPIPVAEGCTLKVHHVFENNGVICDDYENIENLVAGEIVTYKNYSYEDEYEFAKCENGKDSIELKAGENCITIKYSLKDGFRIN